MTKSSINASEEGTRFKQRYPHYSRIDWLTTDYERGRAIAQVNLNDIRLCSTGQAFHASEMLDAIRENCTARIH